LEAAETAVWQEYYKMFTPPSDDASEPASDLFYPIVDNIDRIYIAGSGDYEPAEHSLVGLLASSLYWRTVLRYVTVCLVVICDSKPVLTHSG
jgi:hypothetical protein